MAYNMANIGTIIGHELMHAFDEDSREYNENGEYESWWSENDIKIYKKKQKIIINHYDKMAIKDKVKINSESNLSENIADIGGFIIVEKTLINYLSEIGCSKEEFDKQMRDFYVFYAKEWRTIRKPQDLKTVVNGDPHILEKYRVNSVLALSSNFHRIYGIEKGHRLYSDIKDPLL
jgi:predicted metalloendopeptidase